MAPLNLKNVTLDELASALAPASPSRTAVLKVFAQVFAHGAQDVETVARAPQVPRGVAQLLRTTGTLPRLEVLERRRAADGFVKYLFQSPEGGRFEAVRIPSSTRSTSSA